MGYHVILDALGSVIIGGLLLLVFINVKKTSAENNSKYLGNKILQGNLVTLTQILDQDFKQIGFGRDSYYADRIQLATSNDIKFYTDLGMDGGNPDIVEYKVTARDNTTPNPNDYVLERTVKGVTTNYSFGITKFIISYKDKDGRDLTTIANQSDRNSIGSFVLALELQSTFVFFREGVDSVDQYNQETVSWQRSFYPLKSRNR